MLLIFCLLRVTSVSASGQRVTSVSASGQRVTSVSATLHITCNLCFCHFSHYCSLVLML